MSYALYAAAAVLAGLAVRQEFMVRDYTRAILDLMWAALLLGVGLLVR